MQVGGLLGCLFKHTLIMYLVEFESVGLRSGSGDYIHITLSLEREIYSLFREVVYTCP